MINKNYYENVEIGSVEAINGWFRIVAHREGDNKSFLEGNKDEPTISGKRTKHNYVIYELSDNQPREMRDYLISLNL